MTEFVLHNFDRPFPLARKPVILLVCMGIAMTSELLAERFAHFSSPGLFLLPTIAIVGILSGMTCAMAAAALAVLFVALVFSYHVSIFQPPYDFLVRLCLFSVAAPIIAAVVGIQHRRMELLTEGKVNQALRTRANDLAALAAALELSNQELDQFAYVTSHDLKAPLRGIHHLSQWLEEDLGDRLTPEAREQLRLLRGRVQRMESLINGLLEYAHVGRTHGTIERVDVNHLLGEVIDWISAPEGIRIHVQPGMPELQTDRLRLQQVFTNLIDNAVKHGGLKHGGIEVGFEPAGRFYRFSVTDHGQGIEPKYQQRIFGMFQTLVRRDKLEGTGIGLALVKKLVESKGGAVTVESTPGQGATFSFTWPRAEEKSS